MSTTCFLRLPIIFGMHWPSPIQRWGTQPRYLNLHKKIVHFKQGDQPLTLYYSSLRKTWGELYHYTTFCSTYVKDTVEYKKHVESILIFEFLARMNPDYETGEGSYFLEGPSAILN